MSLEICGLTKSFHQLKVLDDVTLTFEDNKTYCLMSPSGSGKTTLFRILLGLEQADRGEVTGIQGKRFGVVFQADRLCEAFSPLENVLMTAARGIIRENARRELCRLLPEESVDRPVATLSGGMKRRTAICRALLAPSDIVLMDEPFTGLDKDMRRQVIGYIREKTEGKMLILSTHDPEDVKTLGARLVRLKPVSCLREIRIEN